jgi:hypothetical protein
MALLGPIICGRRLGFQLTPDERGTTLVSIFYHKASVPRQFLPTSVFQQLVIEKTQSLEPHSSTLAKQPPLVASLQGFLCA